MFSAWRALSVLCVPEEIIPDSIKSVLESDNWKLMLINSQYKVASDEVNNQITELNNILKKYDPNGMLIGEAPCTKDMIETTDHDFQVVNAVSITCHIRHNRRGGKEHNTSRLYSLRLSNLQYS